MDRQIRLSPPKLPAIPSPRVSDPTLQRTHDAVREVIETIRGTRGNTLDRAVFVRDLVATGVLSLNASTGVVGPGPSIDTGGSVQADTSIPPLLANIIATAGFSYVLLTWDDPQYAPLSHYEIHRLQVNNPNDSPGYTADDARITVSETSQYNTLLASSSRTPVQTVLMQKLGVLQTRTSEYDYAKSYHLLYPADTALEDAYVAASTALKAARLDVAIAQANNVGSASHIGSTPSPVYSDPVDSGATYLYWVRAVSTSGIFGPFNAVGVSATTQPNVSGVIDELTSEVNRGLVTDLIFNGLDSPSNGLSLLEDLLDLRDIAQNAQQNASDALSTAVSAIPASIWDAINALYNRLANSVLNTLVEDYAQSVDVTTLQDRIASAETALLEVQNDTGTLAGRIDEYSVQFDEQFAQIGTALVAFADADAAGATQITALESAIYDPATGLQASHGRIDDILDLTLTGDSAFLTALTRIDAELDNTQGSIADILSLQIRPDSALAARLTDLSASLDGVSGQIQDLLSLTITPGSALAQKLTNLELEFAATNARVRDVLELNIDADSVLARALRQIEGNVATASGAVSDLSQLVVEAERVNALKVTRLEGAIDATKGSIEEILDLRVSPTSVLGTKLTAIEGAALDASGKVSDVLSLKIDPGTVLAGKLTELEAQTDYASGAVSDMLSLRFTSDAIKDSAYANALQSFQLELGNLQSTVQSYTYNVLNDFKDAYGNLTDPVARAGWGVRVEQSVSGVPYVSGFGINQDIYLDSQGVPQSFSEFVVAADRFAIVDPSNPDLTKNSPFIVGPDPDDPTGPSQVWIRDAMISRAAIKSLTAGSVVADMVRAGAFIQTANLYTPTINIGTWALAPGGDAMDPQDWVYNPAAGRQGNFSVDASGIMHATSAVLNSALIKDGAGNVILDAGNGVYSSALLNDSLYLQAVNGQLTLGGTSNPTNAPITLEAFGARALAAGNVNDWNTTDAAVLAKLPTANAHFFHVRLDKTNKQVAVTLRGINTSSTARVRFHLEVVGATVVDPTTAPFNTAQLESTEVPTWSTTNINFAATTSNVIAPNGLCITQSLGWEAQSNGVDQMAFTLSKLDGTVEFRLRLVEFYHASPSDRRMIVLGDSVAVAEFGAAPLEMWFSPRDGSDYDALLLINGPADADATRGAPAGTLVNGVPVENVTTAVTNFNSSNDRNTSAITPAPVIPNTSTAIEHTINADGSANISLDWTWSGTEADIDGFFVQVRRSANQTQVAYTWGTSPAEEVVYQVPANKRAFILFGVPANFRYYFGVRAYRKIDSGLSGANVVNGIVANPLMSAPPVTPAHASASQGYLPSTQVAFTGDIVGTVETAKLNVWDYISGAKPPSDATRGAPAGTLVNGVPVENVTAAVTNFNNANDRNASAIAAAPVIPNDPTAVEHTINADGSANISLDWTWSGTEADIDGFFVLVRRAASQTQVAYTWGSTPADETVYQVPANKRAFILYGVPANVRYYFGIRAYRKVDTGVTGANVVNGIVANPLMSAQPVTPLHSNASQGYLPSTQVAFTGDIVGTVETAKLNVWEHLSGAKPPSDATRNALTYSASEPAAANGDLWVDTSVTPNVLKVRVSGGWQTASNNTTEIGGSGVNHCHPRYTIFNEAVLPPVANVTRAVATLDSAVGYIGLGALKLEATDADAFCYLGSALGDFNMTIQPARQWIVSAWVMSPTTASAAGQFYIRSDTAQFYGGSFTTSATIGQWTRVSALLSLTANTTSTRAILRLDNDAGAGAVIYFDGIMVEPKVGQLTAPSAFVAPPNFLSTYTGDLNATYGAPAGSLVNGVPVENITTAITNFNSSNDRNASAISAAPIIPNTATAVEHTLNADGSANISLDWTWAGTEADIDGFMVLVRRSSNQTQVAYTWNSLPAEETAYQVPANKRAFILYGVPANFRYYFGIRVYRKVDAGVTGANVVNGIVANPLMSAQPVIPLNANASQGYLPSTQVAFTGDIVGSIATANLNVWANISGTGRPADNATVGAPAGTLVNGVPVENITAAVTDFNASNNRNATAIAAPTVPADGTAVDHTINTDGSANISFEWAWGGTEGDIDGFLVYSRMSGASGPYTFGATPADEANETAYQVPANKRAFILFGVPANRYYHFAVRAYRKTDASVAGGLVQSALVQPTYNSSPGNEVNGYQPSSSVAFAGDVTGTINGTLNANQVNIWANISGTGRPADNATKNTVTRSASDPGGTNGDIWIDTTATPHLVKVRVGGDWEISANYLTAGSQLSDYSALSNANITLNPDGTLNNAGSGYVAPFEPYYAAMWDFRSSAGAWAAVNATGTVTGDAYVLTGTATVNPYMRINHGGMSVTGSIYNKVRVKYRRTAGSGAWEGNCYYTTASNTAFSFAYRKTIPSPEATITNGKWYISEWDMENLTAGGTDWVNNVITGLRLDFTSDANETWEVDWVIVGRYGAGEWAMNTINPSNPVTTANIGTYIAQLAVGTLHIGANTVTVPNSATSSTVQQLTPGSWTDLLTVAFSVPTVGLSSIDNNVPFILSWAVEADIQNSGAAVRQWQVLKDGVAIYTSNANLLDTEQFCSGVIKDSINAGATVTFKLQGKGVAGVNVYQKSMWVMAARR